MADVTVDNNSLTDYKVDTVTLSDSSNVATAELVTAVEGGSKTSLAKAEDSAHASGDFGLMALAVRQDTAAALAGTTGDYIPLIVDSSGRLYVNIGGTGGASDLGKIEDNAHSSGDTGIMSLAVRKDTAVSLAGTDGDYIPLITDSVGRLHVNVGAALAASRTVDSVAATLSVDRLMNNLTQVTPTFAVIDVAGSGDNTIVAAAGAGNIILVHQVALVASAAVTVRFESGASGTALTGQFQLGANGGFVLPFSPVGWFKTAANTLLNLELSSGTSVDGVVGYTVVT